jgi:hypothetical protein
LDARFVVARVSLAQVFQALLRLVVLVPLLLMLRLRFNGRMYAFDGRMNVLEIHL